MTIKKAKAEVAERKSKLKIEGPNKFAAAFRRMETFLREMKAPEHTRYFANHGDKLPT